MIEHNVNSIKPNEVEMKQLMKVRRGKSNKVGVNKQANSLIFYIKQKISRDHLNLLRMQYFKKEINIKYFSSLKYSAKKKGGEEEGIKNVPTLLFSKVSVRNELIHN